MDLITHKTIRKPITPKLKSHYGTITNQKNQRLNIKIKLNKIGIEN